MMVHCADDVKAVGHDADLREVTFHQRAATGSEVHVDGFHQMVAFEAV